MALSVGLDKEQGIFICNDSRRADKRAVVSGGHFYEITTIHRLELYLLHRYTFLKLTEPVEHDVQLCWWGLLLILLDHDEALPVGGDVV